MTKVTPWIVSAGSATMNKQRADLSRLYHAALLLHLKQGSATSMEQPQAIGHFAVTHGLETLDIARIHEIAVASLILPTYTPKTSGVLMGRAAAFFTEALVPIEKPHRGVSEANIHLNQIVKALGQRTLELADTVKELKLEILQRRAAEDALKTSELTTSKLLAKSLEMQEELRHLSRQLLFVQEEERRRISRELHDVIAQTLVGINFHVSTLARETKSEIGGLHERISKTHRLVEKSLEIVHKFAHDLRPTMLDDLGLIPALQTSLKIFMEETGIRVSLKVFAGIEKVPEIIRTTFYRITQETLTNVAKHAKASAVEILIQSLDGSISMEITDNGQGFELDKHQTSKKKGRLGLVGMRERAEMIGGDFSITSAPGKPTTIRIVVASPTNSETHLRNPRGD